MLGLEEIKKVEKNLTSLASLENFDQFQNEFDYFKKTVTIWRNAVESSELFKKLEEIREMW